MVAFLGPYPNVIGRFLFAFSAVLLASGTAGSEQGDPAARGPLDGMVFLGQIVPSTKPGKPDYLRFADGQFWSENCVRCGFRPGHYWVRYADTGIAFFGVMHSAGQGTLTYRGLVTGKEIDVSINWRHERWYWTIDKALRFAGRRVTGFAGDAATAGGQARVPAGGEGPASDDCPS